MRKWFRSKLKAYILGLLTEQPEEMPRTPIIIRVNTRIDEGRIVEVVDSNLRNNGILRKAVKDVV